MRIESILPVGKRKCKVLLEEGFAFVLYRGEAERFQLREGADLSQERYRQIESEILDKRARERCFALLKTRDRTGRQLEDKLKEDGYPQAVIQRTMDFLRTKGYFDDQSYARRYVELGASRKSPRQMAWELERRGVDRDQIRQALTEAAPSEEETIRALARKKAADYDRLTGQELYKLYAYLARRGFSYEAIRRALSIDLEE